MFDKIVIVLAESSLPRSSQTKMPTADACESTNPLACLELNLMSLANSPKRIRKDKWPRQGRKGSQDASSFPFFFFTQTKVTLLYDKGTLELGKAYISGPHSLDKDLAYTHSGTCIHTFTCSHTHTPQTTPEEGILRKKNTFSAKKELITGRN